MDRTALVVLIAVTCSQCMLCLAIGNQFTFSKGPVPKSFKVGQHYPSMSEEQVCQPIRLHIERGSRRYAELVRYSRNNVKFAHGDSRLMSSRLHSRLNDLANTYYAYSRGYRLFVLKSWTAFPDNSLSNNSLHYEGRTIQISVVGFSRKDVSKLLKLAVSYKFDWVYYAKWNYIRLSVIPDVCETNIDIVFMQDQSGSVGKKNNAISLKFISDVVDYFPVSPNETRVGLVTFATDTRIHFDLDDITSKELIKHRISRVPYTGGWTITKNALLAAGNILNPANGRGARPLSQGVPRVAVLITDGKSNRLPIDAVSEALRSFAIVYTVGIANYDIRELMQIASDPDRLHVFLLDSFNDAQGFVDFLSFSTCEAPAIVEPGENTTTVVPEDGFKFFQTHCTAFSKSIVIEQVDIKGRCSLFASYSVQNPGPLDSSSMVVRNESTHSHTRSVVLKLKQGITKTVYISVRGRLVKNEFTIIIWDMLFNQEYYSVEALEGVANRVVFELGQEVKVPNIRFVFRIKDGNTNNDFRIDRDNGTLITNRPLNIQRTMVYWLLIVAENSNATCHRGRVMVKVTVIPNNIELPNLSPVSIPEDTPTGTVVTTVQAMAGNSELVRYQITGGNTNNAFSIDSTSGNITVAGGLDFETTPTYSLTIRANVQGSPASDSTIQRINITDVNEQPFFSTPCARSNSCLFVVTENQPAGAFVGVVMADDPDRSTVANGMLSYTILNSTLFAIDSNGNITTTGELDRETTSSYSLTVRVQDAGSPSLSALTEVIVVVGDVNDNAPVFITAPTPLSLFESTRPNVLFAQYIATDRDIGVNREISYSLTTSTPNLPFTIDPSTGTVTTNDTLDFETTRGYNFSVVASNPDGLSTSFDVVLTVIDRNDNSPQFDQLQYNATVEEHSNIGTFVVDVNAEDADSGDFGRVGYQISAGNFNNSFAINETTGVITVNNDIDRELVAMFTLTVEAFDQGLIRQFNTVPVLITVTDINDNAPVFDPDSYQATIQELAPVSFGILTVTATDQDEPGNDNSAIDYTIVSGNDLERFALNMTSGELTVAQSLDFEQQPTQYSLVVRASDRGNPSLSDDATVTIIVENNNEHPPVISGNISINVSELAPVGSCIAQFNASDLDKMDVTFSFAPGTNPGGLFNISSSGLVELNGSLDFERQEQHILEIIATDGLLTDTAFLTVNVRNENEFTPEIFGQLQFNTTEEEPNSPVGRVSARDGDSNDVISFFLQPGPLSSLFTIDSSSGEITTVGALDREMLVEEGKFLPLSSQGQLVVVARDSLMPQRQETAPVTITLIDINDNSPVFEQSVYITSVEENLSAGTELFTVQASDRDIGLNGEIEYFIGGVSVPFAVNRSSGVVTTTRALDREDVDFYSFNITARDRGSPSLEATAEVRVTVLDDNDNPPVFTVDVYTVMLRELAPVSFPVIQVFVNDEDIGENARASFAIVGANDCSNISSPIPDPCFFSINETNGLIVLRRQLDFEQQQFHNITVTATDNGFPRLTSTARVEVEVLNDDEEPPQFDGPCDNTVNETNAVPVIVTTCLAIDNDVATGAAGTVYAIIGGNVGNTFTINPAGEIMATRPLDREERSNYTLTVTATDARAQTSEQTVVITIADINDNAPRFLNEPYSVQLSDEQISSGVTNIVTLLSDDDDIGVNAEIDYAVTSTVTNLTSLLTTVEVTITDRGNPSLSSTTNIMINFETSCPLQEYDISTTGELTASLLCSIELLPSSQAVAPGDNFTLNCRVLSNLANTVQFSHSSGFIGPAQTLVANGNTISTTIVDAGEEDEGEYYCKTTSAIGSLQTSDNGTVMIAIPPTIIVPPADTTVMEGESASFVCVAQGSPIPSISWLREGTTLVGDNRIIPNNIVLEVQNTVSEDSGDYTCRAENVGGRAEATASLTVFGVMEIVIVPIVNVTDPDPEENCNNFNSSGFLTTMNTIISQNTMLTSSNGSSLCAPDPCHPNPCANGGSCNVTSTGMFECTCPPGYMGDKCEEDVNECAGTIPICENGGTCGNTPGGFTCTCRPNFSGQLCEFSDCGCGFGFECESTEGEVNCFPITSSTSVVLDSASNLPAINNIANTLAENSVEGAVGRVKRQDENAGSVTVCSASITIDGDSHILKWVCPRAVQPPTATDADRLCEQLVMYKLVKSCMSVGSGRTFQFPDIPPSQVDVSFIVLDPVTGQPMTAANAITVLEKSNALEKLRENGFGALEFRAAVPEPTAGQSRAGMVGGVMAGVIVSLAVLLVAVAVLLLVVVIRKRSRNPYQPPAILSNSEDSFENHYAAYTSSVKPSSAQHTTINAVYSMATAPEDDDVDEKTFDDPIYGQPFKPKRGKSKKSSTLLSKKLTSSTENLLDDASGEYDEVNIRRPPPRVVISDDMEESQRIYANMQYHAEGNSGQRWEEYQKAHTILRGVNSQ